MEFKGISRVFSTVGEQQYDTIGLFWDELSNLCGRENLRGLGYNWTNTSIEYVIGLKNGEIDGWDVCVALPEDGWTRVKGRTEELGKLYDEIYRDGPLKYEIEMFDDDGNCVIDYVREAPNFFTYS